MDKIVEENLEKRNIFEVFFKKQKGAQFKSTPDRRKLNAWGYHSSNTVSDRSSIEFENTNLGNNGDSPTNRRMTMKFKRLFSVAETMR